MIDCPSLTRQGKSGADIRLALAAMDALAAPTCYDEFVVMSADADFTPLVARLRAADRRVTIVATGPAAAAYRAAADVVMTADRFAELVLTDGDPDESAQGPPVSNAPVLSASLAPTQEAADPAAGSGVPTEEPGAGVVAVREVVLNAAGPVHLAAAAHAARGADPGLDGSWEGRRSFGAWLKSVLPDLAVSTSRPPGYVWDPARFDEADLPSAQSGGTSDLLTSTQRQVLAVTDLPAIDQPTYERLFVELAADLHASPFHRTETSKRLRDACRDAPVPIGRAAVNFVINGLLLSGARLDSTATARDLASAWADNVVALCVGARMELSPADEKAVRQWVGGGLVDAG